MPSSAREFTEESETSKGPQRGGGFLWLAVLLALGMGLAMSRAGSVPPRAEGQEAASAPAEKPDNQPAEQPSKERGKADQDGRHAQDDPSCDCPSSCEKDGSQVLLEFLQIAPADDSSPAAMAQAAREAAAQKGLEVEFLLGMVPDPLNASLDFDPYLDAMSRALEHRLYTLDRFWLPWMADKEKPDGKEGRTHPRCHEMHPGVVLFRQAPQPGQQGPGKVLLLYLVGETPTAGLYPLAFARALADGTALSRGPGDRAVRVIGPSFSGSASSLRTAIDRAPPDLHFEIVSGSATNAENQRILRAQRADGTDRASFHATVIPDDVVREKFYGYLVQELGVSQRGEMLEDLAILSESTTSYGQGFLQSTTTAGHLRPRFVLPYPVHISRLRTAWNKGQGPLPTMEDQAQRRALPLSQVARDRIDIPPLLSPGSVSRDDLTLLNSLTTVCTEHIRYVGLLSLDAEDKHFLAQQLRRFCPDVRLFTLDSDILDAHPDERDPLKGMLVAATYPLFSRNQLWTFPFPGQKERLQFGSGSVQGVYNATLALLRRGEDLLEYGYPFQSIPSSAEAVHLSRQLQRGQGGDATAMKARLLALTQAELASSLRPPIWILAVGDDTLVPVSVIREYDDHDYLYRPDKASLQRIAEGRIEQLLQRRPGSHQDSVQLLFQLGALQFAMLLLGILCALLAVGYFVVTYCTDEESRQLPLPWRLFRYFRLLYPIGQKADDPVKQSEKFWQNAYLFVGFVVLTSTYTVLTGLFFVPLRFNFEQQLLLDRSASMWDAFGDSLWQDGRAWWSGMLCVLCLLGLLTALLDIVLKLLGAILGRHGGAASAAPSPELSKLLLPPPPARPEPVGGTPRAGIAAPLGPWERRWRELLVGPRRVRAALSLGLLLLLATGMLFLIFFFAVDLYWDPGLGRERAQAILFLNRTANPAYGLSPMVPLLCLAVALYLWAFTNLKRICLLIESQGACPAPGAVTGEAHQEIRQMSCFLRSFLPHSFPVFLLCMIFVWQVMGRLSTLEGHLFNLAYTIAVTMVYSSVVVMFLRFLLVWHHFRRFLRVLADGPMVDAYDRMPTNLSRSVGMQLLERVPLGVEMEALWQHFRLLANHFKHFSREGGDSLAASLEGEAEVQKRLGEFHEKIAQAFDDRTGYETLRGEGERHAFFLDVSVHLTGILSLFWARRPLKAALAGKPPVSVGPDLLTTNTAALYLRFLPDDVHLWLRLAEDFLTIQVVTYISRVFPLLRNLLIFVMAGMLLLLASEALYPFQPQRLLLIMSWVLILSVVALTLLVFVQMNQDDILSRIAKSEPGKITWDWVFISRILIYGVFPLLSLVAAQFPGVRGFLFAWVEPVLRALK